MIVIFFLVMDFVPLESLKTNWKINQTLSDCNNLQLAPTRKKRKKRK